MALDTGGFGDFPSSLGDEPGAARPAPTVHSGPDIGQALRLAREARGLTIEELAEATRVRASYLTALEAMNLEALPSRPFVVGYIRACAQALGLDPEAAAERFKAEEPVLDEPLPAPVGVRDERDPRLGIIVAGAVVIIGAIVAWNVVQRVMTESAPASPTASASVSAKALAETKAGPVALGAPLPAPVESTTPAPYITPGIENAKNADGTPLDTSAFDVQGPAPQPTLPATFQPQGAIYGAPKGQTSVVTLQALKPALLVIHGADGTVYFARQLAQGEAYRVPQLGGLSADVSEPDAYQVFVGGQSHGVLPAPLTPIARLLGAPEPAKPGAASAPKPAATAAVSAPAKPPAAKAPAKPTP